jgi:hypothetical protein
MLRVLFSVEPNKQRIVDREIPVDLLLSAYLFGFMQQNPLHPCLGIYYFVASQNQWFYELSADESLPYFKADELSGNLLTGS